uniref:Solute carrier family 5 member 8 n=1 Tax=Electrophorus electricus TaxID=8005 RepID=A0A4W4DQU6_ELEEL
MNVVIPVPLKIVATFPCHFIILIQELFIDTTLSILQLASLTKTYSKYLEMRFDKAIRLFGTVLFIIQTLLYTGLVIYAPALALNQVSGIHLWGAVISTGVVCTFYCTLGGLKAVVWTDAFQVVIMVAGFLAVIIQSVLLQGGVSIIISDSAQGGRLNIWDFDPNPLRRHTFWTVIIGGAFLWTSAYGINQTQVQRYVSCKSLFHAKMSLYVNLVSLWTINLCSIFCGLCLYSVYKNCDPWTAKRVNTQDQLMPYLVLDILRAYPGIPGLFVAAVYSGTLSTVSSSVNALAAVTVTDLIRPYFSFSEQQLIWTSKGLSIFYGALCIGMAGLASLMGGLLQAAISIFGTIGGPVLGLFVLGILFPCANSKGGLAGLVSGLAISLWVCIGAQVYHPLPANTRPLTLKTHGCNFTIAEAALTNWTRYPTQASYITSAQQNKALDRWGGFLKFFMFSPLYSTYTGGRTLKLQPGLTVVKEDLTCYKLYKTLKQKVGVKFIFYLCLCYNFCMLFYPYFQATRNADKLDLVGKYEKKSGNTNIAFCDVELDITKYQSRRTLT